MKNKIKIAVIFDQKLKSGGGYQQAINASILFSKLNLNFLEISFYSLVKNNIKILYEQNIKVNFLKINLFEKFFIFLKTSPRFQIDSSISEYFCSYKFF